MDTEGAGSLGSSGSLGLGWVDYSDTLGSTTLGVLDDGSALGARRLLLASRLVRHLEVELKLTVELDGNLELSDREILNGLG